MKSSKDFLDNCPGITGRVANHIYENLEEKHPEIALTSALALVAALRSGRIETEQKTTPALYSCVIANSGSGKTQAQEIVRALCREIGAEGLLMGEPSSDAALLGRLADEPRRLFIWDEFGAALSELSKSTASFRAQLLSTVMKIFSARGKYIGKEYADTKLRPRQDITDPALTILAASTPGRFFSSINESFVEDGFLSRWLIFYAGDPLPGDAQYRDPEWELIEDLLSVHVGEPGGVGNIAAITTVKKRVARYEDPEQPQAAKKYFRALRLEAKTEIERIFWTRAFEHTVKVALILSDSSLCSVATFAYAVQLVEFSIRRTVEKCSEHLFNTTRMSISEGRERFSRLIEPGEWVTKRDVTRRAQRLNLSKPERDNLIKDLLDAGIWEEQERDLDPENSTRRRTSTYYSRTAVYDL